MEHARLTLKAWLDPLVRRINERAFWYGAAFFELRYRREDPWRLRDSAYEAERHEAFLELLPPDRTLRVLEVGCGEGLFTRKLAEARPQLARLVAVDISRRAVERARRRCARLPAVEVRRADVTREVPIGPFDAILCAEVLSFLGPAARVARVAAALAAQLAPGGLLAASHGASEAARVHAAIRAGAPALEVTTRTGGRPRRWELAVHRAALATR